MDHIEDRVRRELKGEEGSFILDLRCNLTWDHHKCMETLQAFYAFIRSSEKNDYLERELAYGFWFFDSFVKSWTSHESFRAANGCSEQYYQHAYEIIYFLVEWYMGYDCPFETHEAFITEFKLLDSYYEQ